MDRRSRAGQDARDFASLLGFSMFTGSLADMVARSLIEGTTSIVNTLNPYSYLVSRRDPEFREALHASDILIADGIGLVFAGRSLESLELPLYTGYMLFDEVMRLLEQNHGRAMFVGSTEVTLNKIVQNAKVLFPNVSCFTHSPPFKNEFEKHDLEVMRNAIDQASCDVVFFGLTAPKQEKLIFQLGPCPGVKMCAGIGAVFDYFASPQNAPSEWVRAMRLEWLWRSIKSKRLFARNLYTVPRFLLIILLRKLKKG